MTPLPLLAAAVAALLSAGILAELVFASRRMIRLRTVRIGGGEPPPPLSVVIAARDEERGIERALRSVLAQSYPALEVIVVDDRSADRTGTILDRIAADSPRLRVVHVRTLPDGWLGKNHALHRGAEIATGEYILFTDADVVFAEHALERAVRHMRAGGLDHLAAAPRIELPSPLLRLFVVLFSLFFSLYARPWRVRDPKSGAHVGIGAFNLLRAQAYRAIGGHEKIAMRPDDDLKLGKLVKTHGFRQDFVIATEEISVEWYASFGDLVRGLEKNGFAGLGYSVATVVAATIAQLLLFVLPWAAVWVTGGWTAALFGTAAALQFVMYAGAAREQGVRPLYGLAFPLVTLLFLYVVWRATWLTLARGGIEWRGTRYSLEDLRANRI